MAHGEYWQTDGHHCGTLNHADGGLMAAHIHSGSNQRDLQIHGLHTQHERVEIIGEPMHHIRHHHRLHTHGDGTFGEVLAIRERHDVPAANLTDTLLELRGNINGLHIAGLRIQPNWAHRNGMVVQLALLAQEPQSMLNAFQRADHHGTVRVCAPLTPEQHELTDGKTYHHGDQQRAQQHHSSRQQRHIDVQDELKRADHQSREHGPLEQEHVQLVAIPHHMAVIHPHTMQAEHPHQRAHHHICPQIDMEVEAGRIQIDFTLRHHHHNRGDNERNHVAHHQKSIDEEAPIGDAQYPLPGGFPQIFSATTGLGHLPSLSCSPHLI